MTTPINQSKEGNRCWCPVCEEHNKKVNGITIAPWISPEGNLVCVYVICTDCYNEMRKSTNTKLIDMYNEVEANLLNRYPELWKRLPANYQVIFGEGKVLYRQPA